MKIIESSDRKAVAAPLAPARVHDEAVEQRAAQIVDRVRREGDPALRSYALDLDGISGALEVPRAHWKNAARGMPKNVKQAIHRAAEHIRRVARAQVPRP